jgi:hypothetical protein
MARWVSITSAPNISAFSCSASLDIVRLRPRTNA